MGTVIKELVQQGHDLAAELNASCGAVDVRSVAQLISDLASQLDCTALALHETQKQRDASEQAERVWEAAMMQVCGEDGPKSVADKFAELQVKCAALAAENAALKAAITAVSKTSEECELNGDELKYVVEPSEFEVLTDLLDEAPATDAFLSEVRAHGVEMCAREIQKQTWDYQEGDGIVAAVDAMEIYAAQLRQGGAAQ